MKPEYRWLSEYNKPNYWSDFSPIYFQTLPFIFGFYFNLNDNKLLFALCLQIVITGPIAEELFFRGFIYRWLRSKFNFFLAAGLVSIIFTLLHRDAINTLSLFIISMSLCYVYEKTQSFMPIIIFHAFHNLMSLSFFFIFKNLI